LRFGRASLDTATDTWVSAPSLPRPRAFAGCAQHDGRVYVFGGLGDRGYEASVLAHDLGGNTWESVAPMSLARVTCSAIVCRGLVRVPFPPPPPLLSATLSVGDA
jgi:hypothetical protein